jgi:hypothetical protein
VRPHLLRFLQQVDHSPRMALHGLDLIYTRAPSVLTQFGMLLQQLQSTLPDPPDDPRSGASQAALIRAFLGTTVLEEYGELRGRLVDFCRHEAIAPEQVAEVVADRPEYWLTHDQHLTQVLLADWPLRQVCLACRLFWA